MGAQVVFSKFWCKYLLKSERNFKSINSNQDGQKEFLLDTIIL